MSEKHNHNSLPRLLSISLPIRLLPFASPSPADPPAPLSLLPPFIIILAAAEYCRKYRFNKIKETLCPKKQNKDEEDKEMEVDYYNVLKVNRSATEEDLRKAYKRLAMRWHPDKNITNADIAKLQEAEAKFKQISEAYDVLSDPRKRQIYDAYGEEGLKSSSSPFPRNANPRSFRYCARDAEDIFAEFLGGTRAYGESKWKKAPNNNNNNNSNNSNQRQQRDPAPAPAIETKLVCSLEELYKGSRRKMRISRSVPDDFGNPETVKEILKIDIKPGWKMGTKITFPEKGNAEPGIAPADLIFVVDEKPHAVFQREGNDLVVNEKVSLLEALTGKTINLTTLDGRDLTIPVMDIIKPGHEVVVENEGMPISKEPSKKGNLMIRFEVLFPSRLTEVQKSDLNRVLGGMEI